MPSNLLRLKYLIPFLTVLTGIGFVLLSLAIEVVGIGDAGFGETQILIFILGLGVLALGLILAVPATRRLLGNLLLEKEQSQEVSVRNRLTTMLTIGIWFGLVTGFVEAIGFLILHQFTTSPSVWIELGISRKILWIAPIVNVVLFSIASIVLAFVSLAFPRLSILPITVALFAFSMYFNWVSIALMSWTIHPAAFYVLLKGLTVFTIQRFAKLNPARMMSFWRRSALAGVGAVLVLVFVISGLGWVAERNAIASLPEAPADATNVMVIVIDTLRADHLSTYGYNRETSPNIDRIAQEGVLFEAAISTAPWTAPSHASLLTGMYPEQHDVKFNIHQRPIVDDSLVTLPEVLREQGYKTAAFSANTLFFTRSQNFDKAFIRFEDYFHSLPNIIATTAYGRKITDEDSFWWKRWGSKPHPKRKTASHVNDAVLKWLDRDRDKPFFILLNYFDPHQPYNPPGEYRDMFLKQEDSTSDAIDRYDGAIAYVDAQISELMSEMERLGLEENLLLVITSDHGEAFMEHGVNTHANSLYLEETHVPLIFHYEKLLPQNLRVPQPVTIGSLPATVMDILGENLYQQDFPITSLSPLWKNPDANLAWDAPLAQMEHWPWLGRFSADSPSAHGSLISLLNPEWHYIEHETQGEELYKWRNDSLEVEDLSKRENNEPTLELFRKMKQDSILDMLEGIPRRHAMVNE